MWNRYFVFKADDGWFVMHNGRQSGVFADRDIATDFAIERARAKDAAGPAVVLLQGQDEMFRQVWSSVDPASPRYNAAWSK